MENALTSQEESLDSQSDDDEAAYFKDYFNLNTQQAETYKTLIKQSSKEWESDLREYISEQLRLDGYIKYSYMNINGAQTELVPNVNIKDMPVDYYNVKVAEWIKLNGKT